MGNVLAAKKLPTGSAIGTPLTQVDIQNLGNDIQNPENDIKNPENETLKHEQNIHNPGRFSELHNSTEGVFPASFDGMSIKFYNRLSNYFHVHHALTLRQQSTSYRYGANYAVASKPGYGVRPLLSGEMDTNGTLSANMFHRVGNRLELECHTVISNSKILLSHLSADVRGDRSTSSFSLLNPDLLDNFKGTFVAQHLHKFTRQLDLGMEVACKRSNQSSPGGQTMVTSFSARFTGENFVASGTFGPTRLHLCFYQKANDQLHLGVELESYLKPKQSVARIGYHMDIPELEIQSRGSVDSNMNVAAVFEKKLHPTPFTLAISGHLNHNKHVFRLGIGFINDV